MKCMFPVAEKYLKSGEKIPIKGHTINGTNKVISYLISAQAGIFYECQ